MEKYINIKVLLKNFIIDLVIGAVVLLTFAFFHHVLPAMTAKSNNVEEEEYLISVDNSANPIIHEAMTADDNIETSEVQTEPVLSDNVYASKDIRIEVSSNQYINSDGNVVLYHVADIKVSNIECFRTAIANDTFQYFATESMKSMDLRTNAICAMSGDFLTFNSDNMIVRNGKLIRDSWGISGSICVLYYDGTVECYDKNDKGKIDTIKASNPWQTWSFGPVLLDDDGEVIQEYDIVSNIMTRNPRAALGYFEPGHYCFVVVEGRSGESAGALLPELGQIFKDLGCSKAYNLDGGGSAVMTFNHEFYSKQSNPSRELGDILYIAEAVNK